MSNVEQQSVGAPQQGSDEHDHTVELAAEAILREHPDALVCALASDGLITPVPKSVGLWGQAAIEGRALIDHVVAADRKTVIDAWMRAQRDGLAEGRVRLLSSPARWMNLHFLDLRARHGVLVGVVVPTDEVAEVGGHEAEQASTRPRFATILEDEGGAVLDCDEAYTQMFGYRAEDVIGKSVLDQIHPDDQGRAIEAWLTMLSTRRIQQYRMRRLCRDGSWTWVDCTLHNFLNQPDRNHVLVELIDVSAEMAAQERVQEREELLQRLMDTMPDGVIHVDCEHNVVFHNARVLDILQTYDALTGERAEGGAARTSLGAILRTLTEQGTLAFHMALAQVLDDGDDRDVEVDAVMPSGEWRRVLLSIRALRRQSGAVSGAITTVLDVTDSARAREELERRATFDALTHCLNRTSILAETQRELAGPSRAETALVYVDLDHFKQVNDTLGHAAGDEALVAVVERLRAATRTDDRVGRLGGDEFLILIRGLPEPEVAMGVAARIRESLQKPLELSSGELDMCASIGVAWPEDESVTADDLIKLADEAMYRSKQARQGIPVLANLPAAA